MESNGLKARTKYSRSRRGGNSTTTPITSYGIIAYTRCQDNQIRFLLYQRRDTFEYTDFMRGLWSEANLSSLFSLMSQGERDRIRNYVFRELWDDIWVDHNNRVYKEGYTRAKRRFDTVKHTIPSLLETTTSEVKTPSWGFPKGKKNFGGESSILCALREFEEETRISKDTINHVCDTPFTEFFTGSNGKKYCTIYYLSEIKQIIKPTIINLENRIRPTTISDEAGDVWWATYQESCEVLNEKRQNILGRALDLLNT